MNEKNQDKKYHYVYKLIHIITNEYYIGSRSTNTEPELDINYRGSMVNWKISKEDKIKLLRKEILRSDFKSRGEAVDYERYLIIENFKLDSDLFKNKHIPNKNFHTVNCIAVKDNNGKNLMIDKGDPRYLSGELIPVRKGKCTMVDSLGNFITINTNEMIMDSRILSGDIKHLRKDKVTVKDKNGINYLVDKSDPRYLSGELVGICKGTVSVKDKNGNMFRVDINDPRYLSGELISNMKKLVSVKNIEGVNMIVSSDDPRYLSGELVGICKGTITVKDKNGNTFRIDKNDPRYLSGELVGVTSGLIAYNVKLKINNEIKMAKEWSIEFGIENKKLKEYLEYNKIDYIKVKRS